MTNGHMDKRERLTITLKKETLKNLDKHIDGSKIRNRSHAVEYILGKYFEPKVRKALVLTGGNKNKNASEPKAMTIINGRPVLENTIENLRRNDIREIIISIGSLGEKIKNYFNDGSKFGVKIKYIKQSEESGTASPILEAKQYLANEPFLVYYGDVLSDIDLLDMADFHLAGGMIATMAITSVKEPSNWGVARMKGSRIYSYLEKPDYRKDMSHLINAGIYIFEPEIFKYLDENTKRLEKEVIPTLIEDNAINGYLFDSGWHDVGNPEIHN
jgi:NDP-sugar pyrophosphorylase family protein